MPLPPPTNLDPNVVALTRTIAKIESGGNFERKGASGEHGAYQFMPATWKERAAKYLGNASAPMTPENQNFVQYHWVLDQKNAGLTPDQILAKHNSGQIQYAAKKGVNKYGVVYDVPAYVARGMTEFQKQVLAMGGTAASPKYTTETPPETAGTPSTVSYQLNDPVKKSLFHTTIDRAREISATQGNGPFPSIDKGISHVRNIVQTANAPFNAALKYTGLPYLADKLGQAGERVAQTIGEADAKVLNAVLPAQQQKALATAANKTFNTPLDRTRLGKGVMDTARDPATRNAVGLVTDVAQLAGNVVGAKEIAAKAPAIAAEAGKSSGLEATLAKRAEARGAEAARQVDRLTGAVVQGKPADIPAARRALSDLDTRDVKTYSDLHARIDEKIDGLSSKLDTVLDTDGTQRPLAQLRLDGHNYVDDMLHQLETYYAKTNDVPALKNIQQLRATAETEGLSVRQLNDLARIHGRDLNGYNANGELASGLNRQAAENTRVGVKTTARKLFNNAAYDAADSEISHLITTRDLVTDMEDAVNKLQQKIKARTFGEKIGRIVATAVNVVGLNSPKGFVEFFLGRGTGLKTLNAIDLESTLAKNLKLLRELNSSPLTEATATQKLKQLLQEAQRAKAQTSRIQASRLRLPAPRSLGSAENPIIAAPPAAIDRPATIINYAKAPTPLSLPAPRGTPSVYPEPIVLNPKGGNESLSRTNVLRSRRPPGKSPL